MSRIAIIEDDQNIRNLIRIVLSDLGLIIDEFDNGWQGLDALAKNEYSIVILDLMLPGVNGMEICRKIRQTNTQISILMLTSKSEDDDKILGLETGADDYMTKPFSNGELLARVKALLRRGDTYATNSNQKIRFVQIGLLKLDIESKVLTKSGHVITLTAKEYDLIQLFMTNPGRNFTRQEVLERVWGDHFEGLEHTVNSNINRLRIKIEEDPSRPKYLVTVWGIGYRFNKQVEV